MKITAFLILTLLFALISLYTTVLCSSPSTSSTSLSTSDQKGDQKNVEKKVDASSGTKLKSETKPSTDTEDVETSESEEEETSDVDQEEKTESWRHPWTGSGEPYIWFTALILLGAVLVFGVCACLYILLSSRRQLK